MGVIKCEPIPNGRNASVSLSDGKVSRNYSLTFLVEMSNLKDGGKAAYEAPGINFGDHYLTETEEDLSSFCRSINANEIAPLCWHVTVEYGRYDPALNAENPLNQVPEVSTDFAQFEEICEFDLDGNPIVNSAGDKFADPVVRDQSRPLFRISRNEASYDPMLAWMYKDTVNKDVFFGSDPGTVKCSHISARRQYDPTVGIYWTVSYEFHVDPNGWIKRIGDLGINYLDGTSLKPILIQGVPCQIPQALDGSGGVLERPVDSSNAVILEFPVYPETDFSVFNFDSSIFGGS